MVLYNHQRKPPQIEEGKEMMNLTYVKDASGNEICYQVAVELMDDEICEELHEELSPCTDQEFFSRYCEEHEKKFKEEFTI